MADRFLVDLAGTRKSSLKIGAFYAVLTSRLVSGVSGDIVGGGDLSSDLSLGLANTAVVAGTYGDAVTVPVIAVDAKGRITGVTGATITASGIGAAASSHDHAWSAIVSGKPTTLAGYGITDGIAEGDARLTDSRAPAGSASGDLGSSYPSPTVVGLRGASLPVLADGWLKSASGVLSWTAPTFTDVGADEAGTATGLMSAHVIAADPHPLYRLEADSVPWPDVSGTPTTIVGYGITDAVAEGDSRLTDSRAPSGAASGHLTGTYPAPSIASGVIVDAMVNASAAKMSKSAS